MPKENNLNLLIGPIELAAKMFTDQQTRLPQQVAGEQTQSRRQFVAGMPLDSIMPAVLADMEAQYGIS